jgi:hypothetical protein
VQGKPITLQTIAAWRDYLTAETHKLRAAVIDAEQWLAKWEADADFAEQIQNARELRDEARRVWDSHRELCELFAAWSRPILLRHTREINEFDALMV